MSFPIQFDDKFEIRYNGKYFGYCNIEIDVCEGLNEEEKRKVREKLINDFKESLKKGLR